jgi:lipopolysaccharide/colanic/teichoic acid biosynthesis glycosyltransferase
MSKCELWNSAAEPAAGQGQSERPLHGQAIKSADRGDSGGDLAATLPIDSLHPIAEAERVSAWVQSPLRRFCDIALVLAILPVLLPVCLVTAIAVRGTGRGPVLFLQKRVGRNGRLFTILKFRTMTESRDNRRTRMTTIRDERLTKVGRLLRWWKLDELPQFVNVLRGEMSLVGPRPRVPEQQIAVLPCRPGITGPATLAFAQEEYFLAAIPPDQLEDYCRSFLLPLKHRLDSGYMAGATLLSDLRLVRDTALRRWTRETIGMRPSLSGETLHAFKPPLGS